MRDYVNTSAAPVSALNTSNFLVSTHRNFATLLSEKLSDRTTATGQMINAYLQGAEEQSDEAIHLIFSANRWEAAQGILRELQSGCTIVIDRYSFSGAVYTTAKEKPNLSLEWTWSPEVGLPWPDLVLFLDISTEDAAKRGGYGEERYEKQEMQTKVRTLFMKLFTRFNDLNTRVVDAGKELEIVTRNIEAVYDAQIASSTVPEDVRTLPALAVE